MNGTLLLSFVYSSSLLTHSLSQNLERMAGLDCITWSLHHHCIYRLNKGGQCLSRCHPIPTDWTIPSWLEWEYFCVQKLFNERSMVSCKRVCCQRLQPWLELPKRHTVFMVSLNTSQVHPCIEPAPKSGKYLLDTLLVFVVERYFL